MDIMKLHYLFALCLVVVCLVPTSGYAMKYATTGSRVATSAMLVCDKQADAVTFVQAMHEKGLEAAETLFKHMPGCGIAAGTFIVGQVKYVSGVPRFGLAKVVEITTQDGTKYWITNIQIFQKGERAA